MICKHCHQEVAHLTASRKVLEKQTIDILDGKCYLQSGYTIEHPKGKPSYDFRCECGGDLNDKYNECLALLRVKK